MLRNVVIHAGFHKTGTTTVQETLRKNKRLLPDSLCVLMRDSMASLCAATRAYAATRATLDLGLIRYECAELLSDIPASTQTLLLSCEDLSGHMPGRHGVTDYRETPTLMQTLAEVIHVTHPDAQLTLFFTTRDENQWLKSCYAQHLQVVRMILSERDYLQQFQRSARLADVVFDVAARVPQAHVVRTQMDEDEANHFGPVSSLLDLAEVPQSVQAKIRNAPRQNRSPSAETLEQMLILNRSELDDATLKARKRALNGHTETAALGVQSNGQEREA